MPEVTLDMIFEIQRRALDELREVRDTLRDHTRRFGRVESQLANLYAGQVEDRVRLDQLIERVDRIERRLELKEKEPS